jgi:hypothetical protein
MNWFKKLFGRSEPEIIRMDIPLTTVSRWYLYDTGLAVDNANQLAAAIGLTPVSEEGDVKEKQDSAIRLARVDYLIPFLDHLSDVSADTLIAIQKEEMEIDEVVDSKELIMLRTIYKAVSFSSLVGTFSIAVDIGLVDAANVVTSENYIEFMEDENE